MWGEWDQTVQYSAAEHGHQVRAFVVLFIFLSWLDQSRTRTRLLPFPFLTSVALIITPPCP
jgi:hypothetical protein